MKKIIYFFFLFSIISESLLSQWVIQYTPSTGQSTYAIKFYNNQTGWIGSALYGGSTMNLYRTTNGGLNWTAQNSYRSGTRVNDFYVFSQDTAFCVGNFGMLLRTVNGGAVWDSAGLGNYTSLYGIDFINNNTGFVVGDAGTIWKTTNKGSNWTYFSTSIISGLNKILFVNSTTGYIIASANFVYKTTNSGDNWIDIGFPAIPPFDFLREIVATDQNTLYITADIGRVRKTTNGGINWTMLTTPTTEPLFALDYANSNVLYACGGAGIVIKTTDAGANWMLQQTPLNEHLYGMDVVSVDTAYISSWSGKILKTINGGMTFVEPISNEIPNKFYLYQNFPNPFNPSTKIKFDIPQSVILRSGATKNPYISLIIYNSLGQKIATLINENLKSGTYEIVFDGTNFPSGVYFYKLTANEFVETMKMILIK
jgi:photosystem II stability/assembly factor-like uncharacterized protein